MEELKKIFKDSKELVFAVAEIIEKESGVAVPCKSLTASCYSEKKADGSYLRVSNHFDKGGYSINVCDFAAPVYENFDGEETEEECDEYTGENFDYIGYRVIDEEALKKAIAEGVAWLKA